MNKKKIIIINGPNLNLIGKREEDIYGSESFEDFFQELREEFPTVDLEYYQTNIEGEIIDKLHSIGFSYDGIILNAGGYTHSSIAIADAITAIETPVVEVHISNILNREELRHISLIAPNAKGSIFGFGLMSYRLGLISLL